jgi:hypothetical protein
MAHDDTEFEWAAAPEEQFVTDTGDVLVFVTSEEEGETDAE